MADTGIFATTEEVQHKAGANASSTSNVEPFINDYMAQAESKINSITEFNWSDAYSGLNVDVKGLLKEAASNLAAIYVIQYDMTGFSTLEEARTMLDVLTNEFNRAIELLKLEKVKNFIEKA